MPAWLAAVLVVLTSAAVLVLEVLVVRLAAPFVGLTLETYTAAIGVALAAIAVGSALGGRLADSVDPRRWIGPATALGGALVLLARPVVFAVGEGFRGTGPAGTVVLVGLAVALPAVVLSAVPPGVVKLRLRLLAETGSTVGRLSALGTLGALAGTFLTGFVLLAAFSTSVLLLLTGLVLLVVGLVVAIALPAQGTDVRQLVVLVVVGGLGASWLVAADSPCQVETRYYCALVLPDAERESGRTLVLDGLSHSNVDLDDPAHLQFAYTQRFGDVLAAQPAGPLDVLHLGLGGGTMPRYLAAVRPGSRSTVLEVDPQIVELDRAALDLRTGPDLRVLVGDARTGINDQPTGTFDVVVGDAFGSLAVPWHLATVEMAEQVRRVLRPGGTYVLNVIDNPPLDFARAETATLRAVFAHVAVLAPATTLTGEAGGNLVLVASEDPLPVDDLGDGVAGPEQAAAFSTGAPVLTDDDAPVDQLLTPYAAPG
jgi:spermidine synthase